MDQESSLVNFGEKAIERSIMLSLGSRKKSKKNQSCFYISDYFRPQSGSQQMPKAESPDKSDTISIQTSKTSVTGDTEDLIKEEDPPKGCWHSFTKGVGGIFNELSF